MEWVTAGATVVLAILTGVYVYETRRIASRAGESADAARQAADQATRAADSAERGVLIESMPLIIPRSGGGGRTGWDLVAENQGRSVALSVLVEMFEEGESRSFGSVVTDAVAPGDTWTGTLDEEASAKAFDVRRRAHRLEAWYVNAFGQQFRTVRTADPQEGEDMWEFHTDVRDGNFGDWRRLY